METLNTLETQPLTVPTAEQYVGHVAFVGVATSPEPNHYHPEGEFPFGD